MKKLLVPTDFSENSANALTYAVELANRFGSRITLVHLYKVHSTAGMFVSVESYMKEDAAEQMLDLMKRTEPALSGGASIESKVIRGEAVSVIAGMAEKSNYDLIIMGTQGTTGLQEVFFGSTTNGVVKHTSKPVLAIPTGTRFRPIRTMVLAIDESRVSHPAVLDPLIQLARSCQSRILVYHKDTGSEDDGIDPSLDIFLSGIDHSFHYELDAERLGDSIREFASDYQGDLLCMIRRQRGFLKDLFHVSVTSREVFHCSLPLLILHDAD